MTGNVIPRSEATRDLHFVVVPLPRLVTGAGSRGLARRRSLLQDTRWIALDALAETRDVVRCHGQVAHHLVDATLLRQRVAEIRQERMNLVQRLDGFALRRGELWADRSRRRIER